MPLRSPRRTIVGLGLFLILVIVGHNFGWLAFGEGLVRSILFSGSRVIYRNIAERNVLSVETPASSSTDRCAVLSTSLKILQEENDLLRRELHFFSKKSFEYVGAEVIGHVLDPASNAIIINRGARDGLKKGDPVVVAEGILVGKVGEVTDNSAIVQLLTDHRSRVAGMFLNADKSSGLVEGGYEISLHLNLIPETEVVRVGDEVVTSGLEPQVPRGLIIGTVEAVKKEAWQPFQHAILTPRATLKTLTMVAVIILTF